VLLGLLSFAIDDEGHIFRGSYKKKYYSLVEDVGQVARGAFVLMAGSGVQIGRVDSVELREVDKRFLLRIDYSIKEEFTIREDSKVSLEMTTVFQGMHLEITPGTPGAKPLKVGSEIKVGRSTDLVNMVARMGDAVEKLDEGGLGRMLFGGESFKNIAGVLDTLASEGGLGRWVLGDAAFKDLESTISNLNKTVEKVRRGTEGKGAVARLLYDEDLGRRVDEAITDMREGMKGVRSIVADLSEGESVIARLTSDEELGRKLDDIVTDVHAAAADLRAKKSLVSRLISDEELGQKLDRVVTSIADFAENLAKGEGTISRLINDPELFTEIRRFVSQAREAVEDAREAAPISVFASMLFGAVQ
jgi:phospholipid/cholesterol/gamma-HCH transport system substrate-binding protein